MKNIYLSAFLAFLFSASLLTSCRKNEEEKTSMKPGVEMPVDVAEVYASPVTIYKEFPGTLETVNKIDVVGRVNGYLKSSNFKAGDIVQKGQLLFTIEDTQCRNAVIQAQTTLEKAISSRDYYSHQYEAMQKAYEKNAVSHMEVLQAKNNYDDAVSSIKDAEAALETAKTNLSYCSVYAPITGRITESTLGVGSYVGGSGNPVTLASIYDATELYADFFIEDASLLHLQNNGNISGSSSNLVLPIKFSENLKHSYTARISYLSPEINTSTGMIKIRAKLANTYGELRDGMYAMISLPYQYDSAALLVNDASIGTDQLGKYVYLVNDSNKVVYTPIKIGELVQDTMRVVTEGLRAGDRYVTKALLKVRNGKKVKPILTR